MVIILPVKSTSNPDINYEIAFYNNNGLISIICDCPAGEFTKLCKHKLALVRGDSSYLLDYHNPQDWLIVKEWIKQSPLKDLIIKHDYVEKTFHEAQKSLKKLKEIIEIAMRQGI